MEGLGVRGGMEEAPPNQICPRTSKYGMSDFSTLTHGTTSSKFQHAVYIYFIANHNVRLSVPHQRLSACSLWTSETIFASSS